MFNKVKNDENGTVDSIRHLLKYKSFNNSSLMRLILKAF